MQKDGCFLFGAVHGWERDVPLAPLTTVGAGGNAQYFARPETEEQFIALYKEAEENAFILGKGSNVVFSDKGVKGFVISTENLNRISYANGILYIQCGASVAKILAFCRENDLGGAEFLCGIPASAGGLAVMNAGAFGREMKDVIAFVRIYREKVCTLSEKECGFSYRKSAIGGAVLEVGIEVKRGFDRAFCEEIIKKRREKQPVGKTFGSVFRNGQNYAAGELIERAGLKGFRVGGATVSEKHANFILNTGGATAQNIYDLVLYIKKRVYGQFGVKLKEEVRFIGDFI